MLAGRSALDKITNVVHNDAMANRVIDKDGNVVRVSVSFSHGIYDSLKKIAAAKKVSIAWVVRDAVESYLDASAKINSLPDNAASAAGAVSEKSANV
ncbi:MAG: ribbon-helix-helix domain-containing protein [Treponema sp.]|jgi:predicted DNA-binding ribbon-helix-helix protein|nr:ribbon-helix-helix domain-containing protein [Treponema sp.]